MRADYRLVVIGAGVMGQAIIKGIVAAQVLPPQQVVAVDPDPKKLSILGAMGVLTTPAFQEAIPNGDGILLALKPGVLRKLMPEIGSVVKKEQLVLSIAAGITTGFLEQNLPEGTPVVRVMPNAPAQAGVGATVLSRGRYAGQEEAAVAGDLFKAVGLTLELPEENLDAVTGLSGSGPAYVYLMIEALADGGVRMGLPRVAALQLAAQTVFGAASMVLTTGEHPAALKDKVTTPGGTTIEGVQVLEEAGVRGVLMSAVAEATRRSRELGRG